MFDKFLNWRWEELLHLSDVTTSRKSSSTHLQTNQAALRLVPCGEISRAARVLTSRDLASASNETVEKLKGKHPTRSEEIHIVPPMNSTPIDLYMTHLLNAIQESPRGSGAGPSGWCYEHIKVLIESDELSSYLHRACAAIVLVCHASTVADVAVAEECCASAIAE